jgi:hypothetical protein
MFLDRAACHLIGPSVGVLAANTAKIKDFLSADAARFGRW